MSIASTVAPVLTWVSIQLSMSAIGSSASKRRERFHGAFTGGFSAGFYNTVGTAEGWTPSSFSSSRNKRAARLEQRPEDFMDDEDGLLTEQLQARPEFDTLGSTANEIARRLTNGEEARSTIPGPVPSELVVSVGDSMGKRLLRTMGWKEGQGIGSRVKRKRRRFIFAQDDDNDDRSLERDLPKGARTGLGKKAQELIEKEGLTFAPHNIDFRAKSVVVKSNVHGVGYDPFKGAPEFGSLAARKSPTVSGSGTYSTMDIVQRKSDSRAGGGAISAISQKPRASLNLLRGSQGFVLDDGEDHVYEQNLGKDDYDASLDVDGGDRADESRDSLVHYAKAWASETSAESEVMLSSRRYARCPSDGRLPPTGFVVACKPDEIHKYWAPPIPPADFKPSFRFEEGTAHGDIPTSEGRNFKALDAPGRGRLLGEARIPIQDDTPPVQGKSTLSFLPPVARKTLLEAASKGRTSRGSSSKATAAPSPSGEASSSNRSGGLHVTLANRFISETSKAEDNPPTAVDGLVGAAGLKLRTSAPTGATDSPPRATISTARNIVSEAKRNPVRSTFDWRPTSLLCKRLNVPVTDASSTQGLTSKGKRQSGGEASGGELIYREPFQRFTSESSISTLSNRPKVPLLHEAETFPPGATPSNGASTMADQVNTEKLPERPSVDLFKSIFESETESESDEGDESDGDHSFPKATDPVSSPSATHVELKEALQASTHRLLPQRGYGSDSSEECVTDSALPTPSVAQTTIEGSKAKGSSPEGCSHDGASEATVANRQERNRNEMKRSGEKRKRKHKLDSKHSSKRKKDKSGKKHRKHGHKHKSSSRKEQY